MDRFRKNLISFILALWSILLCGGEVNFIITADLHGDLPALALLAPQIRSYPDAVKIDLGDFGQSSFPVVRQHGLPVIEAFNELGYDILVPGNHDLEFPERVLHDWQSCFRGRIMGAQWALGNFRPSGSVVIVRDGIRIGIIALGESGLSKRASFWRDFHYENEVAAVAAEMEILNRADCHAVILTGHISSSNYPVLSQILREFPEIDAVIGAHSHREMPGGIMDRVLICQPGSHGGSAVLLTLHFDGEKRFRFASSRLLRPAASGDPAIMSVARRADEAAEVDGAKEIALFPDAAGFGQASAEIICRVSGADAAITGFDPAKFHSILTVKKLYELFPYGNRIAVVTVDGETARKLLSRRRHHFKYFGAGDFSGETLRLAVNDYMLVSIPELSGFPAEITEIFERDAIIDNLKSREY